MGLIEAIIGLASGVLSYMAEKEALKYVDKLNQLQKDLLAEHAKGYAADDAKIENLEHELAITLQAVQNQFAIFAASKGAAPPPAG